MVRRPAECNSAKSALSRLRRYLSVFEFLFAAPVAALLDEGAGTFKFLFVEGAVEVEVG